MLMRTWASPAAALGRSCTRGLGSLVAPTQAHVLNLIDPSKGLLASPAQPTGRAFSSAFPSSGAKALSLDSSFGSRLFATKTSLKDANIRDPERPKRPVSAYLRFAEEFRSKQPAAKDMKSISAGWKKLSEAQKQPFETAFKSEMVVYNTAFEAYKASGKLDDFRRDPERPKKPMTSFFAWARQQRKAPENAHLTMLEQSAVLGPKWTAMPSEEKAALHAESQGLLEAYRAKLDIYKQSGLEEAWLERTGRLDIIRAAEAKKQLEAESKKEKILRNKDRVARHKERQREVLATKKAKAAAAKEKQKSKLRDEKMKAAKDKEKEVTKIASEKATKAAAVKKEREKVKAALAGAKATKASDKKKAKAAADRLKAREAGEKQKMKAARDRQKAKTALANENAKRAKETAKAAARS